MKRSLFILVSLFGCVGTDPINDPIVGEKIIVSTGAIALVRNAMQQINAEYYDQYGINRVVPLIWSSSNPAVATVDSNGLVTSIGLGAAVIQPSYDNFLGPLIEVNVVNNVTDVALVEISSTTNQLKVGEKVAIQVSVRNVSGGVLTGETVEWFSENSSIIKVDQAGVAEAVTGGTAGIHAKAKGIKSNSIDFTIVGSSRTGEFVQAGGYQASGTAALKFENGILSLMLSDNFKTSFALGTFIYLANSTNGSMVRSSGFEVAQIYTNGAKTFNISLLNPNIALSDYRYVVILCKPASVTFGFADLK